MFTASDLTLETKRMVYRSVVLKLLLYGAEIWAPTQELVSKLDRQVSLMVCSLHFGYQ